MDEFEVALEALLEDAEFFMRMNDCDTCRGNGDYLFEPCDHTTGSVRLTPRKIVCQTCLGNSIDPCNHTPAQDAPDIWCDTNGAGECVSKTPCMHTPRKGEWCYVCGRYDCPVLAYRKEN